MGFTVEGSIAGEGLIDLPNIIRKLDKTGKCSTATLELWMKENEDIQQTIDKEQQWADKSIQYLKTILS
jgi:L-ribulose-5-phosphate 3-epimerase UlaE